LKRADKEVLIESLNKQFSEDPHVIVASFSALTANQSNVLRRKVDETGGKIRVIRNRLAKLAAVGTPAEVLVSHFEGPCALLSHSDDPVVLAKTLTGFIKENPQIELKAGLIDAKDSLDAGGLTELSKLPGLQELRAQLLALFQTPATSLVRLLGTPGSQLARVIDANREKQEDSGE
jgi:large subunit ribosomal protein L10